MNQTPIPEAPHYNELQVVRVSDGETLLQKLQRLLVFSSQVMEVPEQAEGEPFMAFLSGLPADPQRFFQTVRDLVEFADRGVDEDDGEKARRQDVLIADLRGERLRLVRELQSLFELVGKEEAKTDLI